MNEYTAKAKAISKLERYGTEARLRLAANIREKGVAVTDRGIPSSEELADAMAEVIERSRNRSSSPASRQEAQEVLAELEQMEFPTVDDGAEAVHEVLGDLKAMEIPVAE